MVPFAFHNELTRMISLSNSLSICIPVYNCGTYLGEALDSILPQVVDGVEVVIYDGGSTDNTPELVAGYLDSWPCVRYVRAAARGGIDVDMDKCVQLARGEYCWLFSGDDVMRNGAVKKALLQIASSRDAYVCEHTLCDREMHFIRDYPAFSGDTALEADLSVTASRQEWFRRAMNTEAFFSFMSGLVVSRKTWMSGRLIPEFQGSCWAHVARLFELAQSRLSACYVADVWLDQRGGNDSFSGQGTVARMSLAIIGFDKIGRHFFGANSLESFHMRRSIQNEYGLRSFLDAKLRCALYPSAEDRTLLDRLMDKAYGGASLSNLVRRGIYLGTPLWALRLTHKVFKLIRCGTSKVGDVS